MASVTFHRSSMGTVGCRIGIAPHLYVGSFGDNAADALSNAGEMAAKIQNLAAEHPEMAAAINIVPGGGAALAALSAAAKLYNSGLSVKDISKEVGPTAAKVAHSILSLF